MAGPAAAPPSVSSGVIDSMNRAGAAGAASGAKMGVTSTIAFGSPLPNVSPTVWKAFTENFIPKFQALMSGGPNPGMVKHTGAVKMDPTPPQPNPIFAGNGGGAMGGLSGGGMGHGSG